MATFATPGTPISRGLIFHRASTDMSMGDTDEDDSLIMAIRPSAAVGWIMIGGGATFGGAGGRGVPRRGSQPDRGDPPLGARRLDHDRRAAHVGQRVGLGHPLLDLLPRGVQV